MHRASVAGLGLALSCVLAGSFTPRDAHAFCGFYVAPDDKPLYNDASLVVLMRDGTRTVMSMSNNYKGPAADFAMVVPVPVVLHKENVKTLEPKLFTKIEALSAPRLVEYWEEDPCAWYGANGDQQEGIGLGMVSGFGYGAGGSGSTVKIEAAFSVGEYDIVVLSAKESDGLERWLLDNKYKIPPGAAAALAPYVKEQQKFFVAKVDVKKVKMDAAGVAQLSPLRFSYESIDFRLPVRLGLLNANHAASTGTAASTASAAPKQDLIIFTLSKTKRYDVANYPNAFIPTNLDVTDATKKQFRSFYAELFDRTVDAGKGRAIVTEYAWSSGSCDPCPGPTLSMPDIASLGGDVLFGAGYQPSMVLTRLHARYDASSLSEDIVFRAAEPVEGGREYGTGTAQQNGAKPASHANSFQARYAIRHVWNGNIKCKFPQRNVWGGPWGWMNPNAINATPSVATGLAAAPRGATNIDKLLKNGPPAFVIEPVLATPAPSTIADAGEGRDSAGGSDAAENDVGPAPDDASLGSGSSAAVPPLPPPSQRGCACDVPRNTHDFPDRGTMLIVLMGGVFLGRARRRKQA